MADGAAERTEPSAGEVDKLEQEPPQLPTHPTQKPVERALDHMPPDSSVHLTRESRTPDEYREAAREDKHVQNHQQDLIQCARHEAPPSIYILA